MFTSLRARLTNPGWLIETWRRLDSRIKYGDILERMSPDPAFANGMGLTLPTKNSLQMVTHRSCRKLLGIWQSHGRREEPHRTMVESLEQLSYDNFRYNTVLAPSKVMPNRLVKVKFAKATEDGAYQVLSHTLTTDNVDAVSLPLNYFCTHLPNGVGFFDNAMDSAWEMLLILQERADIHGLKHWSKLHKNCRPASWLDRTRGAVPENRPEGDEAGDDREKPRADNYDGGCDVCTWTKDPESESSVALLTGSGNPGQASRKRVRDNESEPPDYRSKKQLCEIPKLHHTGSAELSSTHFGGEWSVLPTTQPPRNKRYQKAARFDTSPLSSDITNIAQLSRSRSAPAFLQDLNFPNIPHGHEIEYQNRMMRSNPFLQGQDPQYNSNLLAPFAPTYMLDSPTYGQSFDELQQTSDIGDSPGKPTGIFGADIREDPFDTFIALNSATLFGNFNQNPEFMPDPFGKDDDVFSAPSTPGGQSFSSDPAMSDPLTPPEVEFSDEFIQNMVASVHKHNMDAATLAKFGVYPAAPEEARRIKAPPVSFDEDDVLNFLNHQAAQFGPG